MTLALPLGSLKRQLLRVSLAFLTLLICPWDALHARESLQVIHTEEARFHDARRTAEGELQIFNTGAIINRWTTIDEKTSPYRTFEAVNHSQFPAQSMVQALGQYHQVEKVLRTSNGQLFVVARTLQDHNDGDPYHRSPNGTFIHEILIPIHQITARQTHASRCPDVGAQFVRSEVLDQAQEWAQAVVQNASQTLQEDRTRREGRWSGDPSLRYMKKYACLSNGEVILSTTQEKSIRSTGMNIQRQAEVFDVINPDTGASRLRHGPSRYWLSASTLVGPRYNLPQELRADSDRLSHELATNPDSGLSSF